MSNDYELCYSRISGRASDLYADYIYGNVVPSDFVKLIGILESNCMDDEAEEVRNELREIIMYDGEDEED